MKSNLLYLFLLCGCASIQSLEGGEKDITPPKILSSIPDSAELNIKTNKITLKFNEYVKLQNVSNLLLISPSQKMPPTTTVKGKQVEIILNDTLLQNTTYTIDINGSIQDNNEGNPLNKKLIFSTGNYIDSMHYSGSVLHLKTNKPCEECNVHLFIEPLDSNILLRKPDYIARTDKSGRYRFTNLPPQIFHLITLEDENKNLLLDRRENISNYKTITPTFNNTDDTTYIYQYLPYKKPELKIVKNSTRGFLKIYLTEPISYNPELYINNKQSDYTFNDNRDTINIFYHPSGDTTKIIIYSLIDTLSLDYIEPNTLKEPLIKIEKKGASCIQLSTNQHIKEVNQNKITVLQDSTLYIIDSLTTQKNAVNIYSAFNFYKDYTVIIDSSFIQTINNTISLPDTLLIPKLNETDPVLKLTIKAIPDTFQILEIIHKENIIKKITIIKDTSITINNLQSGNYNIRLIKDLNKNTIWDTGDPIMGLEPEPIHNLESFELRNNWDKELIINNI